MPSVEVWGPATWAMFHVLSMRLRDASLVVPLFEQLVLLCRTLPCPECAQHATSFLARVQVDQLRTPEDLCKLVYVFHNQVNARKGKPMFPWEQVHARYETYGLGATVQHCLAHFHTRGNMQMLMESFQRNMVVQQFVQWMRAHASAFDHSPRVPESQKQESA